MAKRGNTVLRPAPCCAAWPDRLGANQLRLRLFRGTSVREDEIRSLLHLKYVNQPGLADYLSNHQDGSVWQRRPLKTSPGCGSSRFNQGFPSSDIFVESSGVNLLDSLALTSAHQPASCVRDDSSPSIPCLQV